jgi:hypothetical protein
MQVGGAIGLAVLATLASERADSRLGHGASRLPALNSGYHLAYVIGAVLVAAALLTAITVLRAPAPEEAAAAQSHDRDAAGDDSPPAAEPAF